MSECCHGYHAYRGGRVSLHDYANQTGFIKQLLNLPRRRLNFERVELCNAQQADSKTRHKKQRSVERNTHLEQQAPLASSLFTVVHRERID